ncbi:MAG: DMT family transporter [Pseudomonadota bacterium]
MKVLPLLALVLLAFAGNSLLTRAALGNELISAGMFSFIRLAAGGLVLGIIARLNGRRVLPSLGDLPGIAALLGYVAAFSFAYLSMDAGLGALILFGCVQITTIGWSAWKREPLGPLAIVGLLIAVGGLIYLLRPGGADVAPWAAGLMAGSGVCWGIYTLLGRGGGDPTARTARNFIGAAVLACGLALVTGTGTLNSVGVLMATISGAVTSGLGYALWYLILPKLAALTAGTTQLLVPPATALLAALLLAEPITGTLMISTVIVLGGVALTFIKPAKKEPRSGSSAAP